MSVVYPFVAHTLTNCLVSHKTSTQILNRYAGKLLSILIDCWLDVQPKHTKDKRLLALFLSLFLRKNNSIVGHMQHAPNHWEKKNLRRARGSNPKKITHKKCRKKRELTKVAETWPEGLKNRLKVNDKFHLYLLPVFYISNNVIQYAYSPGSGSFLFFSKQNYDYLWCQIKLNKMAYGFE